MIPEETATSKDSRDLRARAQERFGLLPNFFRLSPETPEITEKLWGFAEAAYLDNPLPSLFKERLFVYLSRFCAVRYCIARHVGFLMGMGHPAGDAQVPAHRVEEVLRLLQRKLPHGKELELRLSLCATCAAPLVEMPAIDSQMEDAVFALASHVFLQTAKASACLEALERLLGTRRFQYLILLITFVRAAHYWTRVHPELQFEDDIKDLLATHEALAACILTDPETSADPVSQTILDELPALRRQADVATSLLAAIVDSSDDGIVGKNLDGTIISWNRSAERLFGYTALEAVGQPITLIIPPDRRHEETTILERVGRGERIEHFDTVRVRKDGSTIQISLSISPVRDAAGKIIGASKIARDITQRKQAEQALRESEERFRTLADALDTQVQFRTQELQRRNLAISEQADQLLDLSRRLMHIQDEERRHIARELHDSAGQTLAALSMSLAHLVEQKDDPSQLAKGLEEANSLVRNLTQELRTTSYLLHPPLLDEAGVSSALRWYVRGLKERSELDIDLQIPEGFERLPSEMELVMFRFVQECLTNVHRHSGSKSAVIRVTRNDDRVYVEVRDTGCGMSPQKLNEIQSRGTGVGIRGMRERLRHVQGELTIESTALGTKVLASFPAKRDVATGMSVSKATLPDPLP